MDEQTQHGRPAEEHLDMLLLDTGRGRAAELDFAFAAEMRHRPGPVELAKLTDQILNHGAPLATAIREIPDEQQTDRARAALKVWHQLTSTGPGDGPLGNWSYCRQLGRAGHDMLDAVRAHRAAQRQARFVGRPGLPPVQADAR